MRNLIACEHHVGVAMELPVGGWVWWERREQRGVKKSEEEGGHDNFYTREGHQRRKKKDARRVDRGEATVEMRETTGLTF